MYVTTDFDRVPPELWCKPAHEITPVPPFVPPPPTAYGGTMDRLISEADARAERIIAYLDDGLSWAEAAAEMGMSKTAVADSLRRYKRLYGIGSEARENERRRKLEARDAEIRRIAGGGVARSAIASLVGCGIGCVHRALREEAANA